ncbi:hypothetical protein [Paenibacillus illinoisensis]|uniref:hypothetical protein n=1 Tax=Paenibacillus illinoisensis TaxID=59845 RepID=UPI0036F2F4B2
MATIPIPPNSTSQSIYTLATIPSGSNVVNLGVVGGVSSSLITFGTGSSYTTVRLAVIDGNGTAFVVSNLVSSANVSFSNIMIDLNSYSRFVYISALMYVNNNNTAAWQPGYATKPAAFNKDAGDMQFVLLANSSTSSNFSATLGLYNVVITSA